MPRGDKDACTDNQKREAGHIEESYEERGVPKEQAEARAWAIVKNERINPEGHLATAALTSDLPLDLSA